MTAMETIISFLTSKSLDTGKRFTGLKIKNRNPNNAEENLTLLFWLGFRWPGDEKCNTEITSRDVEAYGFGALIWEDFWDKPTIQWCNEDQFNCINDFAGEDSMYNRAIEVTTADLIRLINRGTMDVDLKTFKPKTKFEERW
ncbi:hypothetical protein [Acinetobacter nosocomialis]|uniref:hypothetical protein n=1 Tax=Acinetobacter nosocomialis TaxID=106654 RepID=UPI0033AA4E57